MGDEDGALHVDWQQRKQSVILPTKTRYTANRIDAATKSLMNSLGKSMPLSVSDPEEKPWFTLKGSFRKETRELATGTIQRVLGKAVSAKPKQSLQPEDVVKIGRNLTGIRNGESGLIADSLARLREYPMDTSTLKQSKLGVELALPFWKDHSDSAVRNEIAALLKQWRKAFKDGSMVARNPAKAVAMSRDKELHGAAASIEEAIFSHVVSLAGEESSAVVGAYQEILNASLSLLSTNHPLCKALFYGEKDPKCVVSAVL